MLTLTFRWRGGALIVGRSIASIDGSGARWLRRAYVPFPRDRLVIDNPGTMTTDTGRPTRSAMPVVLDDCRVHIHDLSVDRQIAERAQEVVWEHNVAPKDSVHVATALAAEAQHLDTFDGPLIQRDGQIDNLRIGRPNIEGKLLLT